VTAESVENLGKAVIGEAKPLEIGASPTAEDQNQAETAKPQC
jgi:hypothetical protein